MKTIRSPKHILYIDYLDLISLLCAIVMRPFFHHVYFHNYSRVFNPKNRFFKMLSLEHIGYLGKPSTLRAKGYLKTFDLDINAFEHIIEKSAFYKLTRDYFQFDELGTRRLNAAATSILSKQIHTEGSGSIPLMEEILGDTQDKILYLPSKYLNYLLMKEWDNKSIEVNSIHCFLRLPWLALLFAKKVFLKLFNKFKSKKNASQPAQKTYQSRKPDHHDLSTYKIAFFPHLSLMFGTHFKKNYLYDGNPESSLYKEKVLTLFFEEPSAFTKRYLHFCNIPFKNAAALFSLKRDLTIFFKACLKINFVQLLKDLLSARKIFANYLLASLLFKVIKSNELLKKFPNLEAIYVHYDSIFRQEVLLACHLRGIQTFTCQNRYLQHMFLRDIFYDHYCVSGKSYEEVLKKHRYHAENFHPVGLPRANLINKKIDESKYAKYIDLKKKYKLVVCFGFFVVDDHMVSMCGEDGTSLASNKDYLEACLYLAQKFPDHYFCFRFKLNDTNDQIIDDQLKSKIEQTKNLEIMDDLKNFNSYGMAQLADIVIGKQSSIMDECFSQRRKIVFYDNEKWVQAFDYILNKLDIVASTHEELAQKIQDISQGKYIEDNRWDQVIKDYYMPDNTTDPYDKIKEIISKHCSN